MTQRRLTLRYEQPLRFQKKLVVTDFRTIKRWYGPLRDQLTNR